MSLTPASAGAAWALPGRFLALLALIVGPAVALWVLQPVFLHGHISVQTPSPATVLDLRAAPHDTVLAELAAQRPLGPTIPQGRQAVILADQWLSRWRAVGPSTNHPIATKVTAVEMGQSMGVGALSFASLIAPDVLVQAYHSTGDAQYLSTARDLILGFARYERGAWRERGFLWNDHAIAARVGVIIRFWAVYRTHSMFSPAEAAEILEHVARSAALLAKPSHFTAWSNHGVMQNIALLQLVAAFPRLVDGPAIGRLAFDRLAMQLRYYVSDEGVVLEHSAGYHREGEALLRLALRAVEMAGMTAPPSWSERLRLADRFLVQLTRPDGTLPGFGDTRVTLPPLPPARRDEARVDPTALAAPAALSALAIYPLSGYAMWRSGPASTASGEPSSHSVVNWSYFPGQAHKHADETGLTLWADGRGWITPSGYAGYGSVYRTPVEGWLGSNAAHGLGEVPHPARRSQLLAFGSTPTAVLLDLQRSNPDGTGYRRQVASLAGRVWLVIDQPVGAESWPATETLWTFYPDLVLQQQAEGQFSLRDTTGASLSITLAADGGASISAQRLTGSLQPFGGWLATEQGMVPAPALRVLARRNGWTATLFETYATAAPAQVRLSDAEHWHASGAGWQVRRDGARIEVQSGDLRETVDLGVPPETGAARAAIEASLQSTLSAYPKYRNLDDYRLRVAAGLGGLWLLQLLAYVGLRHRLGSRGWLTAAHATMLGLWAGVGLWLDAVYFAA